MSLAQQDYRSAKAERRAYLLVKGHRRKYEELLALSHKLPRSCDSCGTDLWSVLRSLCPPCTQFRAV